MTTITEQDILEYKKNDLYKIIYDNKLVVKKNFKESEAMYIAVNCLMIKEKIAQITKISNCLLGLKDSENFKMLFDPLYSKIESVKKATETFFVYNSYLAYLKEELPFIIEMNRTNLQNVLETSRTDITHTDLEVHNNLLQVDKNYEKAFLEAEKKFVVNLESKLNQQLNSAKMNALRNKVKKEKENKEKQAEYIQQINELEEKYRADFEIEKEAYPIQFLKEYSQKNQNVIPIEALKISGHIIDEDAGEINLEQFTGKNFNWQPPISPSAIFSSIIANFINRVEQSDIDKMQPYEKDFYKDLIKITNKFIDCQNEDERKKVKTTMTASAVAFAENKKFNR